MEERYLELRVLLNRVLYGKVTFTKCGVCEPLLAIYMVDDENYLDRRQLVAMVTEDGYLVASNNGEMHRCDNLQEVEKIFVEYFNS